MRNICSGCRGDTFDLAVQMPTKVGSKLHQFYCARCLARRYPDDRSAKVVATFKAWKNGLLPWVMTE